MDETISLETNISVSETANHAATAGYRTTNIHHHSDQDEILTGSARPFDETSRAKLPHERYSTSIGKSF